MPSLPPQGTEREDEKMASAKKYRVCDGSGAVELQMTLRQAQSASHSGDCEDSVRALLSEPAIAKQVAQWDMGKVRRALAEYGAWDAQELADDDMSRVRMLWILAGDLADDSERDAH
jgi:hypothetical protein